MAVGATVTLPVVALRHSRWSRYVTPGGRATSLPVVALRHPTPLPVVALRHSRWSRYVTPGGRATPPPRFRWSRYAPPHPDTHSLWSRYAPLPPQGTDLQKSICDGDHVAVPTVLVGRVFLIFLFPSPTLKGLPSI
jgi:hypothetical protein